MCKKGIAIIAALMMSGMMLVGCGGNESNVDTTTTQATTEAQNPSTKIYNITTLDIVNGLKNEGMPIGEVADYTAETDPNNLLGRPNSYTGKTNFADNRIEQIKYDGYIPSDGMVEIFSTAEDCSKRKAYVETVSLSQGTYMYQYGNVFFRLDHQFTPAQAEEYKVALEKVLAKY